MLHFAEVMRSVQSPAGSAVHVVSSIVGSGQARVAFFNVVAAAAAAAARFFG